MSTCAPYIEATKRVDARFQEEAENRAENERLSTAYYAKATAMRKARNAAIAQGATPEEADQAAVVAGDKAFANQKDAINTEAQELQAYEVRRRTGGAG